MELDLSESGKPHQRDTLLNNRPRACLGFHTPRAGGGIAAKVERLSFAAAVKPIDRVLVRGFCSPNDGAGAIFGELRRAPAVAHFEPTRMYERSLFAHFGLVVRCTPLRETASTKRSIRLGQTRLLKNGKAPYLLEGVAGFFAFVPMPLQLRALLLGARADVKAARFARKQAQQGESFSLPARASRLSWATPMSSFGRPNAGRPSVTAFTLNRRLIRDRESSSRLLNAPPVD
jgi:hypothetical protein